MESFEALVKTRRSHRAFTNKEIDAEAVRLILRAALMSPTSKSRRDWQFVVVDDRMLIDQLADAKDNGSQLLKKAQLAIVVMGPPAANDCWVEDCSIAVTSMQYQIEDLGLGSCWVQMKGRGLADGTTADEVIRGIVNAPENLFTLCVLAGGHKEAEETPQNDDALKWENVHVNKF